LAKAPFEGGTRGRSDEVWAPPNIREKYEGGAFLDGAFVERSRNNQGGASMSRGQAPSRRYFLTSASALPILAFIGHAHASSISGRLPWEAFAGSPPKPINPMGWYFFTPDEAAALEAIVDRLIPPDELSIGGKEAGCAIFIDRQLAGSYGKASRLYMKAPFAKGSPTQGYQGELTPAECYRDGLRALDDHARTQYGKYFAQLSAQMQDEILEGLESGKIALNLSQGLGSRGFFELVLQNTMEGFFADPLYGGNKGLAGWKLVGFPGARYDYRDHVDKHNVPYPRGPISIYGET
jgi:gluconate 2-dehydrogenase gamma chain